MHQWRYSGTVRLALSTLSPLGFWATYPKHAIILISDGEENNSRYGFGKLKVAFTAPREQTRGMVIRHRDAYYAGGRFTIQQD